MRGLWRMICLCSVGLALFAAEPREAPGVRKIYVYQMATARSHTFDEYASARLKREIGRELKRSGWQLTDIPAEADASLSIGIFKAGHTYARLTDRGGHELWILRGSTGRFFSSPQNRERLAAVLITSRIQKAIAGPLDVMHSR